MNLPKVTSRDKKTRTLHVPAEYHKQIRRLAVERDQDIQDVTIEALRAGLPTLASIPQPSAN